jgi:hypothetical protein
MKLKDMINTHFKKEKLKYKKPKFQKAATKDQPTWIG